MRATPCGLVREGVSSTTSPSRWMLSPGLTGFSQRVSSRRLRELTGWTPRVRAGTESWERIAA